VLARADAPPGSATSFAARARLLERYAGAPDDDDDDDAGPLHNDYNQRNYLFPAEGPLVILDWDRAAAGPRADDVVRALHHLPVLAPASAATFLAGYRAVRALSPAALERAARRLMLGHALKHWPAEAWLRGEAWAAPHFTEHFAVVAALDEGADAYDRFYHAG
jgi:Ser/Thr protein kinase RdoA (MazF antagonist)